MQTPEPPGTERGQNEFAGNGMLDRWSRPTAVPAGLFVLTMAGQKIRAVTRFHLDELYPRFGLARSWP